MFKKLNKGLAILGVMGILTLGTAFAQNEAAPQPGPMGFPYGKGPKHYRQKEAFYKPNIDPQKAQEFCKEIQPEWEKMWKTKRELYELWRKNPPDWKEIEKKEMELRKTQLEIRKKAYEKGLPYAPRNGLRLRKMCGW